MATFTAPYGLGDVVYLRLRDEPQRGMVTRVEFRGSGAFFEVSWGSAISSWHYAIELSSEFVPDFVKDTEKKA